MQENSAKNNIPMNKTTAPPLPPGTGHYIFNQLIRFQLNNMK